MLGLAAKLIVVAAILLLSTERLGHAGGFTAVAGCETLSVSPPLIRAKFWLLGYRYGIYPLCKVTVVPMPYHDIPAYPALGCAAPSALSCEVDESTGVAAFTAQPCLPYNWNVMDSLSVFVGAFESVFSARLYTSGGQLVQSDYLSFPCAPATPTRRPTWGTLKLLYRR